MSSYVGNRSNDPIIDFMLDTIADRDYNEAVVDAAVRAWHDADGERIFWERVLWERVLGPAIDSLESTLGDYGLTQEEIPFTVVGIYEENGQKFADVYYAFTADRAAEKAVTEHDTLQVAGVFAGELTALDTE